MPRHLLTAYSLQKSVPRSVVLQPDGNSEQQAQLTNLLEVVHAIQNACARLVSGSVCFGLSRLLTNGRPARHRPEWE